MARKTKLIADYEGEAVEVLGYRGKAIVNGMNVVITIPFLEQESAESFILELVENRA